MTSSFNLKRGFLPPEDPLMSLPKHFSVWEAFAKNLAKNILRKNFQQSILQLPNFPLDALTNKREHERAMCLLSFIGHALVWNTPSIEVLPREIAIPWHGVGKVLGRPPVLSYASYALNNWYRLDPRGPIALGNIALIQNFLGGVDEEWFVLIHVEIESQAVLAIDNIMKAQSAAKDKNWSLLEDCLKHISFSLSEMVRVLSRMPEYCDPYIYYNRVRPYIHGWKNNPALPDGLIYEGVAEYNGKPQFFCGETGAQSSIIPALDAALGINHKQGPLTVHLNEMRDYMPPEHLQFVEKVESVASVSESIMNTECPDGCITLLKQAIESLAQFRMIHLEYAKAYVVKQNEASKANPTRVGTGGTPFVPYLTKHLKETIKSVHK